MSCGRPSNGSSSATLPLGPSNAYALSTAIHGIRRRSAASASRARQGLFLDKHLLARGHPVLRRYDRWCVGSETAVVALHGMRFVPVHVPLLFLRVEINRHRRSTDFRSCRPPGRSRLHCMKAFTRIFPGARVAVPTLQICRSLTHAYSLEAVESRMFPKMSSIGSPFRGAAWPSPDKAIR
jgi:hypothetical protein